MWKGCDPHSIKGSYLFKIL